MQSEEREERGRQGERHFKSRGYIGEKNKVRPPIQNINGYEEIIPEQRRNNRIQEYRTKKKIGELR